jgi:hypothetical protein
MFLVERQSFVKARHDCAICVVCPYFDVPGVFIEKRVEELEARGAVRPRDVI